jgi:hypothetical protein
LAAKAVNMKRILPFAIVGVLIAAGIAISLSVGGSGESEAQRSTNQQPRNTEPPTEGQAAIGTRVYEALEIADEVEVFISLKEPALSLEEQTMTIRQENAEKRISAVLQVLDDSDLRVTRKYEDFPVIVGHVTASGLEKLARHPDVTGVALNWAGRANGPAVASDAE